MNILRKIKNSLKESYTPANSDSYPGQSIFEKARLSDTELFSHKEIIDAFLALSYDLDEITIRKGHSQDYSLSVISAYGFDYLKDRGRYKKTPQDLINFFVESNYETAQAILSANGSGLSSAGNTVDFVSWMDENCHGWRNAVPKRKAGMLSMHLSDEEKALIDNGYKKADK